MTSCCYPKGKKKFYKRGYLKMFFFSFLFFLFNKSQWGPKLILTFTVLTTMEEPQNKLKPSLHLVLKSIFVILKISRRRKHIPVYTWCCSAIVPFWPLSWIYLIEGVFPCMVFMGWSFNLTLRKLTQFTYELRRRLPKTAYWTLLFLLWYIITIICS